MADILDRLDAKGDKAKWLGVGIGFLTLIIGYLAYKHMSSSAGSVSVQAVPGVPNATDASQLQGQVTGAQLDTMLQQQGVQFQQLESQLAALQPGQSSTGPSANPNPQHIGPLPAVQENAQTHQGGGWWLGPGNETPIADTGGSPGLIGSLFTWLSPGAAAVNPRVQRYIQPSIGTFVPVTPTMKLAPGTPQFTKG